MLEAIIISIKHPIIPHINIRTRTILTVSQ